MALSKLKLCLLGAGFTFLSACGGSTQTTKPSSTSNKSITSMSPAQQTAFATALTALEADQLDAATRQLKTLSSARSDVAAVWLNLALAQYRQQDMQAAQKSVTKALSLSQSSPRIYNLSGLIAIEMGQFEQAEQYLSKAIQLDPQYYQALYNMGLLQDVYLQDIAEAVVYYEKYLVLHKGDTRTQDWLSHLRGSL